MQLLDDATVDSMLRDAASVERNLEHSGPLMAVERDLCCHIKALAADREALHACRKANHSTIRKLHDATIVLRNAIASLPDLQRISLNDAVREATRLIEAVPRETMTDAFDATNENVAKAKEVVYRVRGGQGVTPPENIVKPPPPPPPPPKNYKPSEIWNGWVPQEVYDDATHFIAKLTKERESLLKAIENLTQKSGNETTGSHQKFYTDVVNCARCGKTHGHVLFQPFANPPPGYTHYGRCPSGEPILMKITSTESQVSR